MQHNEHPTSSPLKDAVTQMMWAGKWAGLTPATEQLCLLGKMWIGKKIEKTKNICMAQNKIISTWIKNKWHSYRILYWILG